MPGSQNNLLDFETETLDSTVGGWIVDLNSTVARSTAQAVDGPASLSITSVAAGSFSAKCLSIGARDRTTYVFSAWFRSATAGLVTSFFVDWLGPTGALLSTTTGNTITLVANTWAKVTTVVTPPVGTHHATMYAGNATAAGAGVVVFMDSIFMGSPGETPRLMIPSVGLFPPRDLLRPGARQWTMPTPVTPTIFRVTGTSANSAAATPYTATLAAGCLAGDVLVVAGASQGTHATNGMAVQDSVNAVPFTTILETQGGSASSRWLQTFVYKTPVDLPPGTTLSFTPYAAATQNGFVVDVFRGISATIAQAAVGSANALAPTSVAPALAAPPPVGTLVLTFCQAGSGTLTTGFTAGSTNTNNNSVATGWYGPTGADGTSTYTSTWVLGTSNTSAAQTVALALATAGTNVNDVTAPALAHTTSDVTATITTTDGTAPALAHSTSDAVFGLGVSDGTAPALAHSSFDATVTITTTDGTAPANAHTTADPAPSVAVPDVTAPALAHNTFDATVSTATVLNVNAGDAANAHTAGDPAPSLAVPDVTAPALAHTTSGAGVTLTTTDGTAPALAHTTGDPAVALSLADGTAPALAHTTGQPAPAIAVPDGTAPAITHQAFDATVSTAVILNVNAIDAANTHAAGDPSVKIDQPDPTAPANAHTTQAPSAGLGYADVTAPALAHTTSDAAPSVGGSGGAPATTHQSFDLGVTQTTLAEGTFTTHVTFDATVATSTAPPAFVDVGGSTAPSGGVDGSATRAASEGQSMPGSSTDAGKASSSGLESGATTGSLVG